MAARLVSEMTPTSNGMESREDKTIVNLLLAYQNRLEWLLVDRRAVGVDGLSNDIWDRLQRARLREKVLQPLAVLNLFLFSMDDDAEAFYNRADGL